MQKSTRQNYQSKVNELKARNGELKVQYSQIQKKTKIVEDRIDHLRQSIKSLRSANVDIAQKIESHLYKHKNTLAFETKLKRDVENLEMSQVSLQTMHNQKAQDLLELERKLKVLEQRKESLMNKNSQMAKSKIAMKERKSNMQIRLLELDEELKFFEDKLNKEVVSPMTVIKRDLRYHAGKDEKASAILFTLVNSIITSMKENEFETLNFKTKVNSSDSKIGLRVRFSGVASTQSDIKERIHPIMRAFKPFFMEHGVKLKTKIAKTNGDTVEVLDIAIVMDRVAKTKNLSLRPQL